MGKCPSCGQWSTFEEKSKEKVPKAKKVKPIKLSRVDLSSVPRLPFLSSQLNRFFGGGLAQSSVILMAGEPGIGKSTLLLQLPKMLKDQADVLYISGEENQFQVAERAERLGVEDAWFLSTNNLEEAFSCVEEVSPEVVVIDSVQTLSAGGVDGVPGSPSQVRAVAERAVEFAKSKDVVLFLVGHITKSGVIAGPKLLEHLVDVVVYLEGDRRSPLRVLKCVKNRFGPTNNVVLFEMTAKGLIEVENPSGYFVDEASLEVPGSVLSSVVEGTRAFVVEVQSLVAPSVHPAATRRVASMYDVKRLFFLLAVAEKYLGVRFAGMDVYLNIPGGLYVRDTATDLAVVVSLYSSLSNRSVPKDVIVIGEVGLTGEVRWVRDVEARLVEASSMGVRKALIPASFGCKIKQSDVKDLQLELHPVARIQEAVEVLFG